MFFLIGKLCDLLYRPTVKFKKGRGDHKLKLQTTLLFIVPLFIFVFAFASLIHQQQQHVNSLNQLDAAINRSIQLSELVHELQKERGMTVIFLASKGKLFARQLLDQRKVTDDVLAAIAKNTSQGNSKTFSDLAMQLMQQRLNVDQHEISANSVLWLYNRQNSDLLNVIADKINSSSAGASITRRCFAYVNFLKEKEQIGIERALLGSVFTRGAFADNEYQFYVSLLTKQSVFNEEFYNWVSDDIAAKLNQIKNSKEYRKVEKYRDIAHKRSKIGDFGVDVKSWFSVMSVNINQLKLMESNITQELLKRSESSRQQANYEKWLWIIGLLFVTLLTILYGVKLILQIDGSFFRQLKEYRMILENSSSAMVVIDYEKRDIVFCNSRFAKMLGHSKRQITNMNILDVFLKENREKTQADIQAMVNGNLRHMSDVTLLKRDGEWLSTQLACFPLKIQSVKYLVIDVKDTSDERNAIERLNRSQMALQTVLNSTNSAVSVIDKVSGEIIYLNSKAESIREERHFAEPLWPLLTSTVTQLDAAVGSSKKLEYCYNKSRQRWYQVTQKVIKWYDNQRVVLSMLDDITERYNTEHKNRNLLVEIRELSLKNFSLQERERKQMAADLHDQFGQSMTGVTLQAEFIQQAIKDSHPQAAESAQQVIETTQELIASMRDITNQLRPMLLDQLGLNDALRELVYQWQSIEKQMEFTFTSNLAEVRLNDLIEISVYRIVQESLTNVCKHAQASYVTVDLKLEGMKNAQNLILAISDDGKGFNVDEVSFNGVGLINIRERVESLGGQFRLVANKGEGVNTFISIPLKDQVESYK